MKPMTLLSCALLGASLLFQGQAHAAAATWPNLLNYQAQLTDTAGQAVSDGNYSVKFTIYTAASAGTQLWTETQTVAVTKGLFNAVLGSSTSLNGITNTADLWVGVTVGADPEMTPRQQLLQAVYARNASSLAGLLPNNTANNLVVLDGAGRIPAGLVQGGSFVAPVDLATSSGSYVESLTNSNASSSSVGLTITAANGIAVSATDANGIGVNAFSAFGTALLGQAGTSGTGVSATTASSSKPAAYAAGANPLRLIASNSGVNNIGLQAGTANDDLDANLVDRSRLAAVYANATASGAFGVSASASAGSGIYGATTSNGLNDYGVVGANSGSGSGIGVYGTGVTGVAGVSSLGTGSGVAGTNSNASAGSGVFGSGFMGVQGFATQNNGRGVDGEVPTTVSGAFAVRGSNASSSGGTAIFGVFSGTSVGGIGVRGGSTSSVGSIGVYGSVTGVAGTGVQGFANADDGVGVMGVQGSSNLNPSTYSAGVYGRTPTLAQGTGVRGEGSQGVVGNSAGTCGVCGSNQNTLVGYGVTATSPFQAVLATTSSPTLLSFAYSGTIQSTAAGSAAGNFQALGGSGVTYGVNASNASNAGFAVRAVGGDNAVRASAASGKTNYYSDPANSPAFGFYHQDASAPGAGVGVYSAELCSDCVGGQFINTLATSGSGAALYVQGRIKVGSSAGTFTVTSAGYSAVTLTNPYINPSCLIFLTVASVTSSVAAVTSKGTGSATVTFTPPLSADTTYQYLIIGQ